MSNVIIPEITPDVDKLKDLLVKELPPGCKVRIPPLNRKVISIVKSFGILTDARVKPDKITVNNNMPMYLGLSILFFLPFGIYLLFKMKDGEALRASVHDIVYRGTRKQ